MHEVKIERRDLKDYHPKLIKKKNVSKKRKNFFWIKPRLIDLSKQLRFNELQQ